MDCHFELGLSKHSKTVIRYTGRTAQAFSMFKIGWTFELQTMNDAYAEMRPRKAHIAAYVQQQ